MGHFGYNRTLELMKERFFWPKTYDDVKYFVTKICKCIKDQLPNALPEAPLKTITSSPMELLIITDYFTRYTQVYPTSNKEAKTAATRLFNDFFLRFWTPGKIFHDQGRNLKINYSHTFQNYVTLKDFVQHLIIPSVMAKLRE